MGQIHDHEFFDQSHTAITRFQLPSGDTEPEKIQYLLCIEFGESDARLLTLPRDSTSGAYNSLTKACKNKDIVLSICAFD